MLTTYEIKEVKESVWGITLTLFMLLCILFYYFNTDISIYIQLFTYVLIVVCGIKTFPLCVHSTFFSIENGHLIIKKKHRTKCICFSDITEIIFIENNTAGLRSSRYLARLITKKGNFTFESIHCINFKSVIFFNLPFDLEVEEAKFLSLFEYISRAGKIPIKGTGDYKNISMRDLKYFKDYILLFFLFIVMVVLAFLTINGNIHIDDIDDKVKDYLIQILKSKGIN